MPFPGLGLLYYGQGYLIYPSAFPPGSRESMFMHVLSTDLSFMTPLSLTLVIRYFL